MLRTTLKNFLNEAPIMDYKTIGDFSKGSSFTDKRDRTLVTNPRSVERTKKKFGATDIEFNFYFVNSKEGRKYTEVGIVDTDWVRQNLGQEVYSELSKGMDEFPDAINVIFTNNSGAQKIPLTPWIMAHRIGHALNASGRGGNRNNAAHYYGEAHNQLLQGLSDLASYYGKETPRSASQMTLGGVDRAKRRSDQLFMRAMFHHLGTFRSAREGIIRDWFEVINELIAQYLTTGKIKFNPPPKNLKYGSAANRNYSRFKSDQDYEEAVEHVEMMARDMEYVLRDLFSTVMGDVFVM